MAEEKMTLVERLRNPQWASGPTPNSEAVLDKNFTLATMKEAADEIERQQKRFEGEAAKW